MSPTVKTKVNVISSSTSPLSDSAYVLDDKKHNKDININVKSNVLTNYIKEQNKHDQNHDNDAKADYSMSKASLTTTTKPNRQKYDSSRVVQTYMSVS